MCVLWLGRVLKKRGPFLSRCLSGLVTICGSLSLDLNMVCGAAEQWGSGGGGGGCAEKDAPKKGGAKATP